MSDLDLLKKSFGKEAKNYTKYRESYPEELFNLLSGLIPEGSKTLLDIACGTGKSTEPLVKTNLKITGVDIDPLMIEEAKEQAVAKNLDIDYGIAEAETLPFEDDSFDVITVGTAFHFFANKNALDEIKRVLKPSGLFFVYWILTTKEIPERDAIPSEIFQKYNWLKIPAHLRDLGSTRELLEEFGLVRVATQSLPVTHTATIEKRIGSLIASGSYELLSVQDRESFLNDIKLVLTQKLGDRPYFTFDEEIQVCYGFKAAAYQEKS